MSLIYLIRHAQASFGSEDYDRLSDLGVRQAEFLGAYLSQLGVDFDAVYSGAMKRQTETAHGVMKRLDPAYAERDLIVAEEFNEYNAEVIIKDQLPHLIEQDPSYHDHFVDFFTSDRSFRIVFEQTMLRWVSGNHEIPGVETWTAFRRRIRSGLERVMKENGRHKRIAVFTSGGALCATVQIALDLPSAETIRLILRTRNSSLTAFEYRDLSLVLSSFNSVAHLELQRDPDLITYR